MTIPSSVRRIGDWAFVGCLELLALELCEGLEEIREHALCGCTLLNQMTIKIPSSVRRLDRCYELVEGGPLFEWLEEIGEKAFCDCKKLKQMTIPSSVR